MENGFLGFPVTPAPPAPPYVFPSVGPSICGNGRSLRRGRDGNLYALFNIAAGAGFKGGAYAVYRSTDGGASWVKATDWYSPSTITTAPTSPALAVDAAGRIGLLVIATDPAFPLCQNVLFTLWDGASWSSFVNVSGYNAASSNATSAQLRVDAAGVWYAAWCQKDASSTTSARVQYATRSAGSGGTWGSVASVGAVNSAASATMLLLDSAGAVRIVAKAGASGYLTLYTNASGSWVTFASTAVFASAYVVIDSTNAIFIVTAAAGAIQKVDASGTWSALTTSGFSFDTTQTLSELFIDALDVLYVGRGGLGLLQRYSAGAWVPSLQVLLGPYGGTTRTLYGTGDAPLQACMFNAIAGTLTPFAVTG
jgi:hypothetical protein